MKISYFALKYPYSHQMKDYSYGGSIKAAYHLASEESKRGNDVRIFTSSVNAKDSQERDGNITIYRYGTSIKFLSANISPGLYSKPAGDNTDIVHAHFDIPPGPLAAVRFVNRSGSPFVLTYHGDWDDSYGGLARRIGVRVNNLLVTEKVLNKADIIISPSRLYIERSRFLSRHKEKIQVIPNGIDVNELEVPLNRDECKQKIGIPLDKKMILFFGYLSPYKGPEILLRSMSLVAKEAPNAHLVYAGKGMLMGSLRKLASSMGLSDKTTFAGFVDDDLKPIYYKAADVFCLPSVLSTECYPLSILEAMACRTPVVASDIGGIPDAVINDDTGLLVKPGDMGSLAAALINLLNDEQKAKRMAENAYSFVLRCSWSKIAEETEQLYRGLL